MNEHNSAVGLIYTTWPDEASVKVAARTLLDERVIACVNILGPSTSIYGWQGEVETAQEIVAIFKTTAEASPTVCARIGELHPYDEPAILNLAVDRKGSSAAFLSWIAAEVSDQA